MDAQRVLEEYLEPRPLVMLLVVILNALIFLLPLLG
jgi:hypothetical protein